MSNSRRAIVVAVSLALLLAVGLAVRAVLPKGDHEPPATVPLPSGPDGTVTGSDPGFIYGRIHTAGNTTYEGRLRWGGDQEAFWSDFFNGAKRDNPWAAHAGRTQSPFEVFGIE